MYFRWQHLIIRHRVTQAQLTTTNLNNSQGSLFRMYNKLMLSYSQVTCQTRVVHFPLILKSQTRVIYSKRTKPRGTRQISRSPRY